MLPLTGEFGKFHSEESLDIASQSTVNNLCGLGCTHCEQHSVGYRQLLSDALLQLQGRCTHQRKPGGTEDILTFSVRPKRISEGLAGFNRDRSKDVGAVILEGREWACYVVI